MPTSSADAPGIEQTPRSNSFVGTAEYVPPELLNERSAVPESDLWSLGCVIYQLLVGRPPFKAGNEYQTFQKILKLDYVVPAGISAAAADLIQRLLVENPEDRIGAGGNWTAIKSHPFFFGIPWGQLELSIPPELRSGLPLLSPPTPGGVVPPAPPVVIADEPDAAAIWPGPTGPVITASEPNLPSQLLPPTELFPRSASLDSLNGEAAESRISGSAARPVPPRTMASRPLTLPNGPVPNSLGPAVFATRPTTMVMSTQATEWNLGSRKLHTDILAAQRDPASPLYLFTLSLDPNEVILKYSPSIRRKAFLGLFSPPPRPLVLTSRPRLLAYRPDDYRKVKEQLDLRVDGTWCEILDARRFAIHSHRGGWTLEDSEGGAQAWVDALRRAMVAS